MLRAPSPHTLAICLILATFTASGQVCEPIKELLKDQQSSETSGAIPAHSEVAEVIAKFRADHPDYTLSIGKLDSTVSSGYVAPIDAKHRATLPADSDGRIRLTTDQITVKNAEGRELGSVDFVVWDDEIFINSISVTKIKQRRGMSTYLLAEMLARHPQAQRYVAVLARTNDNLLKAGLKQGRTASDAYRDTPLYRSMQKFGYTRIKQVKKHKIGPNWPAYGVVVERAH